MAYKNGEHKRVSIDHKGSDPDEQARVRYKILIIKCLIIYFNRSEGGCIVDNRVEGNLKI